MGQKRGVRQKRRGPQQEIGGPQRKGAPYKKGGGSLKKPTQGAPFKRERGARELIRPPPWGAPKKGAKNPPKKKSRTPSRGTNSAEKNSPSLSTNGE